MKTFQWVPAPLDDIFPDGERRVLYQTNHRKGYPHYLGRVCKMPTGGGYQCDVGIYSTMIEAAKALLAKETGQ